MINRFFVVPIFLMFFGITTALATSEVCIRIWNYFYQDYVISQTASILTTTKRKFPSEDTEKIKPEQIRPGETLKGIIQPSSHRDIVYELRPNLRGVFVGTQLRTNQFGIRGRPYSLDKPSEGVIRIAGIGDSVMFGWGVSEEESYLSLLEKKLTDSGVKTEILNFAVPGYNTTMEVATFEHRVLPFKPDLVIIHFVNNDLGVPQFMTKPPAIHTIVHSQLLGLVVPKLNLIKDKIFSVGAFSLNDSEEEATQDDRVLNADVIQLGNPEATNAEYRYMVGEKSYRTAMKRLVELTKLHNIPLIILYGGENKLIKRLIVNGVAKRHNLITVEAKPIVDSYFSSNHPNISKRKRRELLTLSDRDPHPNALGHYLYSESLYPVVKNLLVR